MVQKNVCQLCEHQINLMEYVLHFSFVIAFVDTSGMLSHNQFHHNMYIDPREAGT